MGIPTPSWWDLIVAVGSAFIGWLAAWLRMWKPPSSPTLNDKDV